MSRKDLSLFYCMNLDCVYDLLTYKILYADLLLGQMIVKWQSRASSNIHVPRRRRLASLNMCHVLVHLASKGNRTQHSALVATKKKKTVVCVCVC